jgi:type II restriction enzyme
VKDCAVISETEVREQFRRLKPLKEISVAQRGWTLDVLNIVRRLPLKVGDEVTSLKLKTGKGLSLLTSSPTREFTNEDVHAFARELGKLHPGNRHVRDKIRQKLQVLRDTGFLIHTGSGRWRLP